VLENEKKFVFQKHPHPHPRHSTCSALASWVSSGSVPLGAATIPPFNLSQSLLPCSSRPCPRLPPGGAPRRRCDRCARPQWEPCSHPIHERKEDGGWSEWAAKERNKVYLRGASMAWGVCELRARSLHM
jgi:hypothetical protein